MLNFLLALTILLPPLVPPENSPQILLINGGKILSIGGPLQFDQNGIQYIGEPTIIENGFIIDSVRYKLSPDFWTMIHQNLANADATKAVQVKNGQVFFQNRPVDFGASQVKGIGSPIFWQGWVLGFGGTSKFPPPPMFQEFTIELIYFNIKSLKGDSVQLCNKCNVSFWILNR